MKRALFLSLCLLCGGWEPWRAYRPVPSSDISTRMPRLAKQSLPSGIQLLVHQDSYLPLAHIRLVFRAGWATEPSGQAGSLDVLYRLIFDDNESLLAALDRLGSAPQLEVDADHVAVSLQVRSEDFTTALELLLQAIREPRWDSFEQVRESTARQFLTRNSSPQRAVRRILRHVLFPSGHPLHRSQAAVAEQVRKLKLPQLQALYKQHAVAKNLGIAIAGRVNPSVAMAWVKKGTATLSEEPAPVVPKFTLPQPTGKQVVLLPYKGLSQSVIAVGTTVPPVDHQDAVAIETATTWFAVHVHEQLRQNKQISYGVEPQYEADMLTGGVWLIASVESSKTGYAAREVMSQLFAAKSADVNAQFMPMLRGHLIRDITESCQTLAGCAEQAQSNILRDDSYWSNRLERIKALAPNDVYKALRDHVKEEQLAIVIAGDPAVVEPQLKEFGLPTSRIVTE